MSTTALPYIRIAPVENASSGALGLLVNMPDGLRGDTYHWTELHSLVQKKVFLWTLTFDLSALNHDGLSSTPRWTLFYFYPDPRERNKTMWADKIPQQCYKPFIASLGALAIAFNPADKLMP